MQVVGREELENFKRKHADAANSLDAWVREVSAAAWNDPHDVKARYPRASPVGDRIVVFNIRGGQYRLAVRINYPAQVVQVLRIGTHEEYDDWKF